MIKYEIGKYYKLIDKKSKKILCAGKLINSKECFIDDVKKRNGEINYKLNNFPCISFDNRYFFRLKDQDKFILKENKEELFLYFNENNIPSNYIIKLWRDVLKDSTADIYREFDILELDEEVKNIVKVLNRFDDVETVGSCSGHGIKYLWVDIKITSMSFLKIITKILEDDKFNKDFVLTTCSNIKNSDDSCIVLRLRTFKVGDEAYKLADELAESLNDSLLLFNLDY